MDGRSRLHRAGAIHHECVPLKLPEFFRAWLKRNRDLIGGATTFVVAILSVAVVSFAVHNINVLDQLDTLVNDLRIASFTHAEPQDKKIVVAAITEATLGQPEFQYREPVDRGFLADLLLAISAQHPRAIGLDILLDSPSQPEKDEKLRKVIRSLKAPIAISFSTNSSVVTDDQKKFLADFIPARDRSLATLASDQHDVVRWVYPGERDGTGHYLLSFPRAIAQKVGVSSSAEQVAIVWHGQPEADVPAFAEYPAINALLPFYAAQKLFAGKIVLIGSDLSLIDRHATPFDVLNPKDRGGMAGILVQAHALSQLLDHRPQQNVGWLTNLLIALFCAGIGALLGWIHWPLAGRITLSGLFISVFLVGGFALFSYEGIMIGLVIPTISHALALWATESLTGREAKRQREFIQGAFSRYVSPKVVEQLVKDPDKLALQGERRVMSFIFTDIANFTTMSESLEGHDLQVMLNEYLEGMTTCVQKFDGMVDKFIGDAVMAIFNAPLDDPDHAHKAVLCALEMDRFTEHFNAEQRKHGVPWGITRIGVHTGPAVIGNFGSKNKFNYTAQGDTVNAASRLEGLNKTFGTHISVSGAAKELCRDTLFRPIAAVILKGKSKELEVWEPLQANYPHMAYLARYNAAYEKLKACDPEALPLFESLHEEMPDDPCVELHLERLREGETGVAVTQHEK